MSTHTFTILEISREAFDEIKKKLEKAGYEHTFDGDDLIDMHEIALRPEKRDNRRTFYLEHGYWPGEAPREPDDLKDCHRNVGQ